MEAGAGDGARRRFDLTMLHAVYDAFRRDMARMAALTRHAGADGTDKPDGPDGAEPSAVTPAAVPAPVLNGWTVFAFHWRAQHAAEHRALWTVMRGRPVAALRSAALDTMDLQAARLVGLMDTVDAALEHGDGAVLARRARDVPAAVNAHLAHKEAHVLPLIPATLTPYEWGAFDVEFRRQVGLRGLGVFLQWLLDGAPDETCRAVLRLLPPPVRFAYRRGWSPRYRRRALWPEPSGTSG
ncbi:hypothetical protein [Actinomadura roseirufa]|uniref:hypothetical protein n=1 Tax=Actinomadura roseirufa TaxID=2094049 RepID=UPI00104157D8|nr:hypothetical protein [Actinomadura roseirufa]